MSEYKNFNRCTVCRSAQNLKNYQGEFEVTMLLNTLYLTVISPIEARTLNHTTPIYDWLTENISVNKCNNDFNAFQIVRFLRNGLAHMNIHIASENNKIEKIKICAVNEQFKPKCEKLCENRECLPKQYKISEDKYEAICIFTFTIDKLREFTGFMIEQVLNTLPKEVCYECKYNSN